MATATTMVMMGRAMMVRAMATMSTTMSADNANKLVIAGRSRWMDMGVTNIDFYSNFL